MVEEYYTIITTLLLYSISQKILVILDSSNLSFNGGILMEDDVEKMFLKEELCPNIDVFKVFKKPRAVHSVR